MTRPFRFVAAFVALTWICPGSALDLKEMRDLLIQKNEAIQAQKKEVDVAGYEKDAAFAKYFPTANLETRLSYLDDDVELDISPLVDGMVSGFQRSAQGLDAAMQVIGATSGNPAQQAAIQQFRQQMAAASRPANPERSLRVLDRTNVRSTVTITQPLYAGGRIVNANRAAEGHIDEANADLATTSSAELRQALTRYFQAQQAVGFVKTLEDIRTNLKRLQEISQKLLSNGVIPKHETLQLEVALAEMEAKIEEARTGLTLAHQALRVQLAMETGEPLDLTTPLRQVPLSGEMSSYVALAREKRAEFRLLDAKLNQVEALKKIETGGMLPSLFAFGKYEVLQEEKKNLTALDPRWAIGVGLNIPITAGLEQFPRRWRAQVMIEKVNALHAKAMREIPLQVESFHAQVTSHASALRALRTAINQAEEASRLATVRYNAGQGSTLEVLTAANDLEKVRIRELQTLEAYNRSLIDLHWSMGDLDSYVNAYVAHAVKGTQEGTK